MNYVNDRFQELMGLEMNQKALEVMKKDVDAFMPGFSDSPEKLSRWGHHYFCDDDGGRLIFDLNSPKEHRCVVCGKVYRDETQNGVWITFYRNRAVVMTLVSALIYKATGQTKYRDYAVRVMEFYAEHYQEFQLHNKENVLCESYDNMVWGCGKMMPQGLNEAIVAIRFIQTIEILRDELDSAWLERIHQKLFREMFRLMAPQAVAIHNISCWSLSAIGVMGLAMHDQEMIDYAFKSQFNMHEQLKKGVTKDGFWYEGSIHYNFFLLEGVSYLFLFSKIYDYSKNRQMHDGDNLVSLGASACFLICLLFASSSVSIYNSLYQESSDPQVPFCPIRISNPAPAVTASPLFTATLSPVVKISMVVRSFPDFLTSSKSTSTRQSPLRTF